MHNDIKSMSDKIYIKYFSSQFYSMSFEDQFIRSSSVMYN